MEVKKLRKVVIAGAIVYLVAIIAYATIVIYAFSDCHGNLGNAGLFGDMFGAFNAFFTGLAFLAVALTIFLQIQENKRLQTQITESRKEKEIGHREQYLNSLLTAQSELSFYRTKFIQLSAEVQAAVNAAQAGQAVSLPTYRFYPTFLENQKVELSKFHFNSELIKILGNCHFELRHIIERLVLYLEQMNALDQQNAAVYLGNSMGFKGLLDNNIINFEDAITQFQVEIDKVREEIAG